MKKIDEKKSVWYARYNPFCVQDMILPAVMKKNIQDGIDNNQLTHLGLFSTVGGLGKSALCHAIIKECDAQALWVNASIDRGIDIMRGRIGKFASSSSLSDSPKIVVMDEFDNFSRDGQAAFRGFIDEFGSNCTFIFTGNYKDKIIDPLLTRLNVFDFAEFPREEMVRPIFERLSYILDRENVKFAQPDLVSIINTFYPSIRQMIGSLQNFSADGQLTVSANELDTTTAYAEVIKLLTPTTYFDMVVELNKLSSPDNMYSHLYKNASTIFPNAGYPRAIVVIAKYQDMSTNVRDKHVNLAACMTELISCLK